MIWGGENIIITEDFSEKEEILNQVLKEIRDTYCWMKAGKALLERRMARTKALR